MTHEEHLDEFLAICVAIFRDLNDSGRLDEFLKQGGEDSNYLSLANQG
jgi:hypothetical protein